MSLDSEKRTYDAHLGEWGNYQGKYVLIRGSEVVGFFDTYSDAITQGYERFGLDQFLVKQVDSTHRVQYVTRLVHPTLS